MQGIYPIAFKTLVAFLEDLETRNNWIYMIVGGALTPLYAQSRMTQDIDVVLQLHMTDLDKTELIHQLSGHGFKPFTNWADTFQDWPRISIATLLDPSERIKVDINFVASGTRTKDIYKRIGVLALPRRVRKEFLGVQCWIQSKEDFIIAKLVYNGIQDYKDALACWLKYETDVDVDYLISTAKDLGVLEFLQAIRLKKPVDQVFPE